MVKTRPYDTSEYLDSEETIAAYLNAAFQDGDPGLIAAALGDVAKAAGMSKVASAAKVSRESLYRSLSAGGNPELATVIKVARSFGLRLSVTPQKRKRARPNPRPRRRAAA